jgi:hypothetical protein
MNERKICSQDIQAENYSAANIPAMLAHGVYRGNYGGGQFIPLSVDYSGRLLIGAAEPARAAVQHEPRVFRPQAPGEDKPAEQVEYVTSRQEGWLAVPALAPKHTLDEEGQAQFEAYIKAHYFIDDGDAFSICDNPLARTRRALQFHAFRATLATVSPGDVDTLNGVEWQGEIRLFWKAERHYFYQPDLTSDAWYEWLAPIKDAIVRIKKKRGTWRINTMDMDDILKFRAMTLDESRMMRQKPMIDDS